MDTPPHNRKTLDLGCNNIPRNPYNYEKLYGIDIGNQKIDGVTYVQANLALEPIPFPDDYFDCVSAFDFIEHIPRILAINATQTRLPFIELMNEIWRVLKPNGIFYAVTPAYPKAVAFQDPTHVNIITKKTHRYFCGKEPMAKIYGFQGEFEAMRTNFVSPKTIHIANNTLKSFFYNLQKNIINPSQLSHFLWELKAKKER